MTFPRSIAGRVKGESLLQILRTVEKFEDVVKRGESPPLDDFLVGAIGAEREELLRQLLGIELDYRRLRGESPNPGGLPATVPRGRRRSPRRLRAVHRFLRPPAFGSAPRTAASPHRRQSASSSYSVGSGAGARALPTWPATPTWASSWCSSATIARPAPSPKAPLGTARRLSGSAADTRPGATGPERVGDDLPEPRHGIHPGLQPRGGHQESTAFLRDGGSAQLIEQVAEGLEAVHACGLVHRDVKPSNIVQGDDHVPRLVDFGLATHLGSVALQGISGSPPYMAPEQARGEWLRIDVRTDVYGLGAVLYALLTGHPPHPGATENECPRPCQEGRGQAASRVEPIDPSLAGIDRPSRPVC